MNSSTESDRHSSGSQTGCHQQGCHPQLRALHAGSKQLPGISSQGCGPGKHTHTFSINTARAVLSDSDVFTSLTAPTRDHFVRGGYGLLGGEEEAEGLCIPGVHGASPSERSFSVGCRCSDGRPDPEARAHRRARPPALWPGPPCPFWEPRSQRSRRCFSAPRLHKEKSAKGRMVLHSVNLLSMRM